MGKTKEGGTGSGWVTQSWEKRKFVSKSKVKSMAAQNYAWLLQTAHEDDWVSNPGDLREFGDRAINFFNPADLEVSLEVKQEKLMRV